ncbi:hypothetical protein AMATHDRAFT_83726 [Amanita thiersii Skay4041]|uniref:Uncharacterized protein n=1 Tax=Amanita thiersii Skay4041 TaxID=703135 RepID=A0A2A9NTD6_9AGAR|nr:hypothetical protein AMATHDRAFT_83726 [Amanita thiersii Skay4041]
MPCSCSVTSNPYVDKATQTDSECSLFASPKLSPWTFSESVGSNTQESAANTQKLGAYTYLRVQDSTLDIETSPTQSTLTTRQRYPQLPCNRPFHLRSSIKRVLSLPEDQIIVESNETPHRVFSMPARLTTLSPNTSSSFSSAEVSSNSLDSPVSKLSNAKNPCEHSYRRSDVPSTPSPPSSPESIMIIGNDTQLPRTFLRSSNFYKQAVNDSGSRFFLFGVVYVYIVYNEAGSRGRVHRPGPYLRCMALHHSLMLVALRAEGTIIEGEDLSNMIWGLNLDESQSRAQSHQTSVKAIAHSGPSKLSSISSFEPLEHGPIDLSNLFPSNKDHSIYPTQTAPMTQNISSKLMKITHRNHYVSSSRPAEQEQMEHPKQEWHRGLGFNWQETIELPPPKGHSVHSEQGYCNLKPSAASFVPSTQLPHRSVPRVVVEPRFSDYAQNLWTPEIHRHARNLVPTPYVSTPLNSPCPWSPYVAIQSDSDSASPQTPFYQASDDKQLIVSCFSPASDYVDDMSNWVTNQIGTESPVALTLVEKQPGFDLSQLEKNPEYNVNRADNFIDTQLPSSRLHLLDSYREMSRFSNQHQEQKCVITTEKRFRGISQQPRSIPLARLIQRRLSSVTEEDLTSFLEDKISPESLRYNRESESNHLVINQATVLDCKRILSPVDSTLNPQTLKEPEEGQKSIDSNFQCIISPVVKLPPGNICDTAGNSHMESMNTAYKQDKGQRKHSVTSGIKIRSRIRTQSKNSPSTKP